MSRILGGLCWYRLGFEVKLDNSLPEVLKYGWIMEGPLLWKTCGKIKSLSIIYLTECLSPLLTALSFNLILVTFLIEQNGHQKEFFGNVFCTEWLVKEKDVLLDFISSQYRLFDTDLDINILEIFELLVQQFKCECICQFCVHDWSSQGPVKNYLEFKRLDMGLSYALL